MIAVIIQTNNIDVIEVAANPVEETNQTTFYSIKDLETLSGIKAHTIRIWEKRYNIINPHRTDTNIRRYDDSALKKILLVSSLNNQGVKISKLADLSTESLRSLFNERAADTSNLDMYIDQLVIAMIEMDEGMFSQSLEDFTERFGFERTVTDIFFPFCEKIGVMWMINKIHPAHEHFITNMIRLKLFSEINKIPLPLKYDRPSVVLFLREGEYHEIGLLFYNYMFRVYGFKTIYLGQDLPMDDLIRVTEYHDAEILVSALITKLSEKNTQNWVQTLHENFPDKKIILSGQHLNEVNIEFPDNVYHLKTADELSNRIKQGNLFPKHQDKA